MFFTLQHIKHIFLAEEKILTFFWSESIDAVGPKKVEAENDDLWAFILKCELDEGIRRNSTPHLFRRLK